MNKKTRYDSMPRDDLIAEILAWENKNEEAIQIAIAEGIKSERKKLIEETKNMIHVSKEFVNAIETELSKPQETRFLGKIFKANTNNYLTFQFTYHFDEFMNAAEEVCSKLRRQEEDL